MAIKSKKVKRSAIDRRKIRIRKKVEGSPERPRVSVFRSSKHTYAQAICDTTGATVAAASTLDSEVISEIESIMAVTGEAAPTNDKKSTKSVNAARAVGRVVARRLMEKKLSKVVFDRNGFLYAGRLKAVADGAREAGLEF